MKLILLLLIMSIYRIIMEELHKSKSLPPKNDSESNAQNKLIQKREQTYLQNLQKYHNVKVFYDKPEDSSFYYTLTDVNGKTIWLDKPVYVWSEAYGLFDKESQNFLPPDILAYVKKWKKEFLRRIKSGEDDYRYCPIKGAHIFFIYNNNLFLITEHSFDVSSIILYYTSSTIISDLYKMGCIFPEYNDILD